MTPLEVRDWCLNYLSSNYPGGQLSLLNKALGLMPSEVEAAPRVAPPLNPEYPARLVVLVGLTDITYLDWLIDQPEIKKEVRRFIILINNEQDVCNILHNPRMPSYLASPFFKFILCPGLENAKPLLFSILKQPEYSKVMDSAQLFPNCAANEHDAAVHEAFCNGFMETVFHVYHNYGRIDDSLEGVRSTLLNSESLRTCPGIQSLRNAAKGRAAAIIGAGPSLDADIKTLAKNRDKLIIYAADAAVKPLLKAGITPDFTTSIERGNLYQIPFWKDLPPIDTTLVFFPVVHPEVLKLYPGPKRIVYRNYSYYAYFEKNWPKGLMQSGGSTSHLANRLASYMGCDNVILVGIDSVYEKHATEDTYRSHCHNLGHGEWAEYHPLQYFHDSKNHAPSFDCVLNSGKLGKTNITYHQWAKEFSEDVLNLNAVGRIFTAAKEGIQIPNVPFMGLVEFCEKLSEYDSNSRKFPIGDIQLNREFSQKGLLRQVSSWLNVITGILESTSSIPNLTMNDVGLVHNVIHHRLLQDHMFVGFIIQNCAAEFYKLENKWSALPLNLSEALPERLSILRDHALLYEKVLGKLKKIVENPEEEIK